MYKRRRGSERMIHVLYETKERENAEFVCRVRAQEGDIYLTTD